jgi:3-oxoacyl-(acyl-carrier-protein) synthase
VRPFDADRQGVILGEGAAAVVIEPVERARARGATRLATLRGVGTSCDAHHVTAPLREGVRRAFREAHRRAGVTPDEIDVVMAHGTGTLLNDLTEAQVLGDVFADAARRPVVTALKSLIGHTSGPSGLMSLVTAIESLHTGKVPPTRNHANPIDEIRDFQVVTGQACEPPLRTAQVNAFGFGGVNAVSVLDRESEPPAREPVATGRAVAVTGVGVEIPGVGSLPDLLALTETGTPLPNAEFDPSAVLGRRGLRYKDRATLLGLCAAHKALAAAGLSPLPDRAGESFGIVVATELALVETVCRVVGTIHAGGVRETSPMDLPNASGNVAAAQIAIWYGLAGLSLTVSSGPTSGLDALYHAAAAIRAGRSDRILVIGVEPGDQQSLRLLRNTARRHGEDPERLRAFDGACAVVLEAGDLVTSRGVTPLGWVGDYVRHTWVDDTPDTAGLWALPCLGHNGAEREADAAVQLRGMKPDRLLSLSPTIGEASAAYGVLQYAAAATRLAAGAPEAVVSAGGCWRAEFASLRLRRDPSDDPSGAPA